MRTALIVSWITVITAVSCGQNVLENSRSESYAVPDEARAVVDLYSNTIASDSNGLALTGEAAPLKQQIKRFGSKLGQKIVVSLSGDNLGVTEVDSSGWDVTAIFKAASDNAFSAAAEAKLSLSARQKAAISALAPRFGGLSTEEFKASVVKNIENANLQDGEIDPFMSEFVPKLPAQFGHTVPESIVAAGDSAGLAPEKMLKSMIKYVPKEMAAQTVTGTLSILKEKSYSSKKANEIFSEMKNSAAIQEDPDGLASLAAVEQYVSEKSTQEVSGGGKSLGSSSNTLMTSIATIFKPRTNSDAEAAAALPRISYVERNLQLAIGSAMAPVDPSVGEGVFSPGVGASSHACSAKPALPTGLSFSGNCRIGGTPMALAASADYIVTVTNDRGESASSEPIEIAVLGSSPAISFPADISLVQGQAMMLADPAISLLSAGPYAQIASCSVVPSLPAGLTIGAANSAHPCAISGTPTTLSAATGYFVTVANTFGNTAVDLIQIEVTANNPSISFASNSLSGTVGQAVAFSPVISAGVGVTATCAISGALPAGMSFNTSSCAISGTPTVNLASTNYTITLTNSLGNTDAEIISIAIEGSSPSIAYGTIPALTVGSAMTLVAPSTLSAGASGTPVTCSGTVAAGLTLDSDDCEIHGTPTAGGFGTANYTITATNAFGKTSQAVVSITVNGTTPTLSFSGNISVNKDSAMTPVAPTLNVGTGANANLTNCTVSPSLPAGLSLSATNCSISGTPTAVTASAVYTLTATNSFGNTVNANVTIEVINAIMPSIAFSGDIDIILSQAMTPVDPSTHTAGSGATMSSCSADTLPAGLSISSPGCQITGTPTSIGDTVVTVTVENSFSNQDQASVTISVQSMPSISYADVAILIDEAMSDLSATVSGGTGSSSYSCSAASLPSGLSIDSGTCVISGTPDTIGSGSYAVTVTNNWGNTAQHNVNIDVESAPSMSYAALTGGSALIVDQAMSTATPTLDAGESGTPLDSCTAASLPAGLSVNNSNCEITGTPTATGSGSYNITVTNAFGRTDVASISIDVESNPSIAYGAIPNLVIGQAMSTVAPSTLSAGTNGGSVTCSGSLPGGLTLDSDDCEIHGTPSAVGSANYTITVTNGAFSNTDQVDVTITVVGSTPSISYASAQNLDQNVAWAGITPTLNAGSGGATVSNCTVSPALPTGMSLNASTCVISGTPSAAQASTTHTVTVENSFTNTAQGDIDIEVASSPAINYTQTSLSLDQNVAMTAVSPASLSSGDAASVSNCTMSPSIAGLSINSTSCQISGTPTSGSASQTVTITVTNSPFGNTTQDSIDIEVKSVPTLSFTETDESWIEDTAITNISPASLSAGSGATMSTCAISPSIDGIAVNDTTCVISGTPTTPTAQATYTITATNSFGETATDQIDFTIVVDPCPGTSNDVKETRYKDADSDGIYIASPAPVCDNDSTYTVAASSLTTQQQNTADVDGDTVADSDNDTVADGSDQCPGADDLQIVVKYADVDNDGLVVAGNICPGSPDGNYTLTASGLSTYQLAYLDSDDGSAVSSVYSTTSITESAFGYDLNGDGDSTDSDSYYVISTPAQWIHFAENCTESITTSCDKNIVVVADLDFSDLNSGSPYTSSDVNEIICNYSGGGPGDTGPDDPYIGTINGLGRTISNINFDMTGVPRIGLVGFAGDGMKMIDLNVTDSSFDSDVQDKVAVIGQAGASITLINVHVDVDTTGKNKVAGLLANAEPETAGAVVTITDCSSRGTVNGINETGGLIGKSKNPTFITGSYSLTTVIATGDYSAGLIGKSESDWTIVTSFNAGTITSAKKFSSGIANGKKTYTRSFTDVYNSGNVTNTVSNSDYFASGIYNHDDSSGDATYNLTRVYSVGTFDAADNDLENATWDSDQHTSGTITGVYYYDRAGGYTANQQGTAKSEAQLKQQATYSGWNFSTIWTIDEATSMPYFDFTPTANKPTSP